MNNLEKYKEDIDRLIKKGEELLAILSGKNLEKFREDYEVWYSESLSLIKVILPDRLEDFKSYYYQKGEETCLKVYLSPYYFGSFEKDYAVRVLFENQLGIVKAAKRRFESSLFDIKKLVQGDLFDSELDTARELNQKGFVRGAGAIAGVVLEKHLTQVCKNRNINISKKNPSINDLNQLLKNNNVISTEDFHFIQYLASLRHLCTHNKEKEPEKEKVEELIKGVEKLTKTIF